MTACIAPTCNRELRDTESQWGMVICTPCVDRMRAALTAIPAALKVLHGSMQRERTGDTSRAGTRTAPLPCREEVLNLVGPASIDDISGEDQIGDRPIIGVLGDWVYAITNERRINGPSRWTETDLANWLIPQLPYAAQQTWVDGMYEALWKMTRAIRGIASNDDTTRAVQRPCPTCDLLTLSRSTGDQYTRCSQCLGCWTDSELNDDAPRQLQALTEQRTAA